MLEVEITDFRNTVGKKVCLKYRDWCSGRRECLMFTYAGINLYFYNHDSLHSGIGALCAVTEQVSSYTYYTYR